MIAQYTSMKKITDPEYFRIALEREEDPNILSGREGVITLCNVMGVEIDYDRIFPED